MTSSRAELARGKDKGKRKRRGRASAGWRQGLDKLVVARLRKRYPGSQRLVVRRLRRDQTQLLVERRLALVRRAKALTRLVNWSVQACESFQSRAQTVKPSPVQSNVSSATMFSPSSRTNTPDTPSAKHMLRKRQMGIKSDLTVFPERYGGLYEDPCTCGSQYCLQCVK